MSKEDILKRLSDAVLEMEDEDVVAISKEAIEAGVDAFEAIDKGLADGMNRAGKLFEEEEYFVPELLMCSDAMNAGLEILKPHLKVQEGSTKHKIVIAVVEGDTHDIGKNLVKLMLETSGFEVVDAGRDIPAQQIVDIAKKEGAEIICLSTLMTTTMKAMEQVIEILNNEGLKDKMKVMVGGGPISKGYATKIGADGYSINAADAVRLAKSLVGEE